MAFDFEVLGREIPPHNLSWRKNVRVVRPGSQTCERLTCSLQALVTGVSPSHRSRAFLAAASIEAVCIRVQITRQLQRHGFGERARKEVNGHQRMHRRTGGDSRNKHAPNIRKLGTPSDVHPR